MPLAANSRLGPYEILSALGAGGMGAVYRARDTRLNRDVALKVLHEDDAASAESRSRFEREARAIAALNHPNIVAVYDFGLEAGQQYIVSELVDGASLRAVLAGKPMPLRQLLDVAAQVADGLAAAHAAGFVHRDLKPENIMLGKDGRVKILDFGLARQLMPPGAAADHVGTWEQTATFPSAGDEPENFTQTGIILGTASYMSPEQARGEKLDARTDLFSFGVVLYELATALPPFPRGNSAVTFDAILHRAPVSPLQLNPKLPTELERIIIKSLEKDRDLRYQSAAEMRGDLKRLLRDTDSGASAAAPPSRGGLIRENNAAASSRSPRRTNLIAGAGLALIAVVLVAYYLRTHAPVPAKVTQVSHWNKPMNGARISPDGRTVAFTSPVAGFDQVFVMLASGGDPLQITTDSADKGVDSFSPDGTEINYDNAQSNDVWTVPTLGGMPRRVAPGGSLVDSMDGNSFFFLKPGNGMIFRKPKSGVGEEVILNLASEGMQPRDILPFPDGKDLLIAAGATSEYAFLPSTRILYKINLAASSPDSRLERMGELSGTPSGFAWGEPGSTVFFSRTVNGVSNLWKYSLQSHGLQQITFGAGPDLSPMPDPAGKGIYFVNGRQSGVLTTYDTRTKRSFDVVTENATQPVLSFDRSHVAYIALAGNGRQELWVSDMEGNHRVRLASSAGLEALGFSPDSSQFSFTDRIRGATKLFLIRIDGSGLRQIPWSGAYVGASTWSPDGKTFYFTGYEKDPAKSITWEATGEELAVKALAENCGYVFDTTPDGKFLVSSGIAGGGMGIGQISVAEGKCDVLARDIKPVMVHMSSDARSILYLLASGGETTIYRQPWQNGRLSGPAQVAIKLPFAFRQLSSGNDSGNSYDFSNDLSTIVYARSGGQADLYLLNQK